MEARGIRNNNPLNITFSASKWVGKVKNCRKKDRKFEEFVSMKFGLRAAFSLLRTYNQKRGLTSISSIINRFAPPVENPTSEYAVFVAKRVGVGLHEDLGVIGKEKWFEIVRAMSIFESGFSPSDELLESAWELL